MAERPELERSLELALPARTGESPPANRAERRAKGDSRQPAPHGAGKVRPVRFDHATDPRQFAAHRRG